MSRRPVAALRRGHTRDGRHVVQSVASIINTLPQCAEAMLGARDLLNEALGRVHSLPPDTSNKGALISELEDVAQTAGALLKELYGTRAKPGLSSRADVLPELYATEPRQPHGDSSLYGFIFALVCLVRNELACLLHSASARALLKQLPGASRLALAEIERTARTSALELRGLA